MLKTASKNRNIKFGTEFGPNPTILVVSATTAPAKSRRGTPRRAATLLSTQLNAQRRASSNNNNHATKSRYGAILVFRGVVVGVAKAN